MVFLRYYIAYRNLHGSVVTVYWINDTDLIILKLKLLGVLNLIDSDMKKIFAELKVLNLYTVLVEFRNISCYY